VAKGDLEKSFDKYWKESKIVLDASGQRVKRMRDPNTGEMIVVANDEAS